MLKKFQATDGMVCCSASFKVTQGITKIGKVVRGTHDLQRPDGCCAVKGALMSQFFEIVASIWPILAFDLGRLILRPLVGDNWSQSGFDPNAPRRMATSSLLLMGSQNCKDCF